MKQNLKRRFTYWYIKKGCTFGYDELMNPIWKCPWLVRPFLIFFSPSVYFMRKVGEVFCDNFRKALKDATNSLNNATNAINEFAEQVKKSKGENYAGF